jgi:phosphatidylglycerophosphate synthase
MLDRGLRRVIDPYLDSVAGLVQRCGCSANQVSFLGFLVGIGGCVLIALGHVRLGLLLLLFNRLADGVDGMIARRVAATGAQSVRGHDVVGSDCGGFLDIVLDLLFYAAVPLSFGLLDRERNLLPATVLLFSFFGTSGSFLAYAIVKAKRGGVQRSECGGKSFFYSVGLMEGSETVMFFAAFCLWPERFAVLAWVFAGLCMLTTLQRILAGLREFR